MRIFNQEKTQELFEPDLEKGYLQSDTLFIQHHNAVEEVKEQGHYETLVEYPNGGKDVSWVVDVPAVEAKEAYDEYENIQVYIPYSEEELESMKQQEIRNRREKECFPIINRGSLWYNKLTEKQKAELSTWYEAWLDAPATNVIPNKPSWII